MIIVVHAYVFVDILKLLSMCARYIKCHSLLKFTQIQATGLDLTEADIDLLISKLDQDGDGEIDYG